MYRFIPRLTRLVSILAFCCSTSLEGMRTVRKVSASIFMSSPNDLDLIYSRSSN